MTHNARVWIPESALADSVLLSELDGVIAAWSHQWFPHRPIERTRAAGLRIDGRSPADREWRSFAPGVAIAWSKSAAQGLARNALAMGDVMPKTSEADDRLLNHYAERIARELARALAALLGLAPAAADSARADLEGIELQLRAAEGGPALSLRISESALVSLRKKMCRPYASRPTAKVPLADALAACPVTVEALLGYARITARDLQNIAPGDVIMLERATTDPVLLQSTTTKAVIAGVEMTRVDGELQLMVR